MTPHQWQRLDLAFVTTDMDRTVRVQQLRVDRADQLEFRNPPSPRPV